MGAKVWLMSIVVVCLFLGASLGIYMQRAQASTFIINIVDDFFPRHKLPTFLTDCYVDSDCRWISTNCCPPNAGAIWECKNVKISTVFKTQSGDKEFYVPIECSNTTLICTQDNSPEPIDEWCVCKKGTCFSK